MNVSYKKRLILLMGSAFAAFTSMFAMASNHCDINGPLLSFPRYDFLSLAPTDTSGQLTVQCAQGIPYSIKISAGLNSSGDFSQRHLLSGDSATPLYYNLYLDPGYSQIWGEGQAGTNFYQNVSSGLPSILPIYGRIPPKQSVPSGVYRDTVVITVEW